MDVRARADARADVGVLLERDEELGALRDALAAAAAGISRVTLIEGPAGIGKSRLMGQARDAARRRGFRVLAARGSDLERGLAFGVVRQLFEQPLSDPDNGARR